MELEQSCRSSTFEIITEYLLKLLKFLVRCAFFPRFHGGFTYNDHLYLAMEECVLGTLGSYDKAPIPMTPEDR